MTVEQRARCSPALLRIRHSMALTKHGDDYRIQNGAKKVSRASTSESNRPDFELTKYNFISIIPSFFLFFPSLPIRTSSKALISRRKQHRRFWQVGDRQTEATTRERDMDADTQPEPETRRRERETETGMREREKSRLRKSPEHDSRRCDWTSDQRTHSTPTALQRRHCRSVLTWQSSSSWPSCRRRDRQKFLGNRSVRPQTQPQRSPPRRSSTTIPHPTLRFSLRLSPRKRGLLRHGRRPTRCCRPKRRCRYLPTTRPNPRRLPRCCPALLPPRNIDGVRSCARRCFC